VSPPPFRLSDTELFIIWRQGKRVLDSNGHAYSTFLVLVESDWCADADDLETLAAEGGPELLEPGFLKKSMMVCENRQITRRQNDLIQRRESVLTTAGRFATAAERLCVGRSNTSSRATWRRDQAVRTRF
jgi:hypothetical protein